MRYAALALCLLLTLAFAVAAVFLTSWYVMPALLAGLLAGIGIWDLLQSRHSVLRNYPVAGHLRWLFEEIRPEIRQYFMESDIDGRPFDRDARALVYERSKNIHGEQPFGTELDVTRDGYEWFLHSMAPKPKVDEPFRLPIGGPDCKRPYAMALLNVSAMLNYILSAHRS